MEQQRFVRKNKAMYDAARRQDRKRTRRTVFYVCLLLAVTIVFTFVCAMVFLKVKNINISGNKVYSTEQIMEYVPIENNQNIYSFNADEIESNILTAFPYIKYINITRDLPTTVNIRIIEEKPYYAANIAGDAYIISADLKVLECRPNTSIKNLGLAEIKLSNVRRCIVGSQIEFVSTRDLQALTALYDNFKANYIQSKIKSVDFSSRFDITFNYDNRFKVYIGDTDDLQIKMLFLVSIIDELDPTATGTINISNPREASYAPS